VRKNLIRPLPQRSRELLAKIGILAAGMGYEAYLVGGIVRDLMIAYPNTDLDIAVEGDSQAVARKLASEVGGTFKRATRFGTSKVDIPALGTVDFATVRAECYRHPGALPDVEASDIMRDLARRDFTVNAMAMSLSPQEFGGVLDPHGGSRDLKDKYLRVLHDGSFIDDPTRALRGVRFAARYGFGFERRTSVLLNECIRRECLRSISGKRILTELRLICSEENVVEGLRMLNRLGILRAIDNGFAFGRRRAAHIRSLKRAASYFESQVGSGFAVRWVLWFSSLFFFLPYARADRIASHLNLPKHPKAVCAWVSKDMRQVGARLSRLSPPYAYKATKILTYAPPEGLIHLYAASSPRLRGILRQYLTSWRHVSPEVTGGHVVRLGIEPGPLVGKMLDRLLRLKLLGKVRTKADEIAYIKKRTPGSKPEN
jgi:tRNA nucleotidyltransferase (CCA-adding enzyme)